MRFSGKVILLLALLVTISGVLCARAVSPQGSAFKTNDLTKYHNVGNIWLRVSNYGFFGSGDDINPKWPSLEYPGGSGIDYLYQGALWFGAKKYRRNADGKKLYWNNTVGNHDPDSVVAENAAGWNSSLSPVLDTLVSAGFDGDADRYEFLPAFCPLDLSNPYYDNNSRYDTTAYASTRIQKRGVDDDGDGKVDEDAVGYTFPFRSASELPAAFSSFGGDYLANASNFDKVYEDIAIWFPLGFMNLGANDIYISDPISGVYYNFSKPHDDDRDGLIDEDGAPVSEQDYISYYYDYSPIGTSGERDYGNAASNSKHIPLKVRVRQMSYQWSYEYIKNLCYVEFDITNMNVEDTLFDCAMGIYMDSDVGPQSYDATKRAEDDKSGYVMGEGFEFAYTYDYDFDGGITNGYVGSRVCTPDPEKLEFSCWFWAVGQGPIDEDPQDWSAASGTYETRNQKYKLLTGFNPKTDKFTCLRGGPSGDISNYEQPEAKDTRYLFAFYGVQQKKPDGQDNPDYVTYPERRWNLAPKKTMKIVIAIFPGETIPELKATAIWAKSIYGPAQDLQTVILPDTVSHYNPPEPPDAPKMTAKLVDKNKLRLYWDNGAEFTVDTQVVEKGNVGWTTTIAGTDSDPNTVDDTNFPLEYQYDPTVINNNALVNPFTAWRLRHDFQGYSVWGRSGSGKQDLWILKDKWDKIETAQDLADYNVNNNIPSIFENFGGYQGIEKGLPNPHVAVDADTNYYHLDSNYFATKIRTGDPIYGYPIYNTIEYSADIAAQANALSNKDEKRLLFKNPDADKDVYLTLCDDRLIPLEGFIGYHNVVGGIETPEKRAERLARRYYTTDIANIPQGTEYYCSATAYDRGMPRKALDALETGKDASQKVIFPGALAQTNMDNIMVIPNPYRGLSKFDGRREGDDNGDKSRRIWFTNLPEKCTIKIFTLAGDLVQEINHNGSYTEDVITISKAVHSGMTASGIHSWNLLSKNNQIIASGIYLFSVKDANGDIKVGKFVIIR